MRSKNSHIILSIECTCLSSTYAFYLTSNSKFIFNFIDFILFVNFCSLGSDLCLVSAAIMGLQSLMHPLEWVAPAISILPHKLAEFLECPVPLLAGLVVDALEPQLQSLRNMSSSNTSTSFFFSSKELQSEFNVGDIDTGGVKCSPGTLKAASLRAAKLLIQCG